MLRAVAKPLSHPPVNIYRIPIPNRVCCIYGAAKAKARACLAGIAVVVPTPSGLLTKGHYIIILPFACRAVPSHQNVQHTVIRILHSALFINISFWEKTINETNAVASIITWHITCDDFKRISACFRVLLFLFFMLTTVSLLVN